MTHLRFRNMHIDGPSIATWSDALLRLTADFELVIDETVLYRQPEFPIVELASQLHVWLVCGATTAFQYESMDSDENPLIWFRPNSTGWIVGVRHPLTPQAYEVRHGDLVSATRAFLIAVDDEAFVVGKVKLLQVLIDPTRPPRG